MTRRRQHILVPNASARPQPYVPAFHIVVGWHLLEPHCQEYLFELLLHLGCEQNYEG